MNKPVLDSEGGAEGTRIMCLGFPSKRTDHMSPPLLGKMSDGGERLECYMVESLTHGREHQEQRKVFSQTSVIYQG